MKFGSRTTLRRFEALAASYGADLGRWPPDEREQARVFLASSAQARQALADAAASDDIIASVRASEDARLWAEGEQDAALTRLRAGVAGRIGELDRKRPAWRPRISLSAGSGGAATLISPASTVTAFGLAAAAGLWVGWMQGAAMMPQPSGLMTFLLSSPVQGLGW